MRRSDLARHLAAQGARQVREGSRHSIWQHGSTSSAVPRHREIAPTLARAICRQLNIADPPGR